eukprot:2842783-Prymnesium_polylepis.1
MDQDMDQDRLDPRPLLLASAATQPPAATHRSVRQDRRRGAGPARHRWRKSDDWHHRRARRASLNEERGENGYMYPPLARTGSYDEQQRVLLAYFSTSTPVPDTPTLAA